jgi:hypothetical protein
MIVPAFAQISILSEKIAEYAIKGLAVAGAFLVGYFLGGLAVWAIDKWLLANKSPPIAKKICKLLVAVVVSLIVALIVFGESGNGLFGRGGGEGNDKHNSDSSPQKSNKPEATSDGQTPSSSSLPKPPELKPADTIIQVTIYGGIKVVDEKYYQIDDDQSLKTIKELQDSIIDRKSKLKGKVAIAIRLPSDKNIMSADPRVMDSITDWASKQGIDVILPANK